MKTDLLKECVSALRAFRARKHKERDASVIAELDDSIEGLERCLKTASDDVTIDAELRMRALETMSRCLNAATNLAEIARKVFGPE